MSTATYGPHLLHLRFPNERDGIMLVDLLLDPVADDVDAVRRDGNTIGYIRQVGRVFVALRGRRLDYAVECGQSLLWDKAAMALLAEADASGQSSAQDGQRDRRQRVS